MKELRCLSEPGRVAFTDYLQRIRQGASEEPPVAELSREPFSIEFLPLVQVDESLVFPTRYQMGEYLNTVLKGIDRNTLLANQGIWDYLTLLWFNQVCPQNEGQRSIRENARYIVSPDRTDYYRHLVLCAWELYSLHGIYSRLFLECPPHIHNDWTEQLASRQEIITNKALIEAADRLYWDKNQQRPKTGATDRNRPGNVRRLVLVMRQLDLTYDLHAMSVDEIVSLLPPREFRRWRSS